MKETTYSVVVDNGTVVAEHEEAGEPDSVESKSPERMPEIQTNKEESQSSKSAKKRKLEDPYDARAIAQTAVFNVLGDPDNKGQEDCDDEFGKR